MKRIAIITAIFGLTVNIIFAQKYITKEGVIDINSETSLFTIEAKNQKVASILDASTGEVVASTLVRSFKFREALVEEHFNENYMQSVSFPKAIFKGKITNLKSVDFLKNGTYEITLEGDLTMHGETRPLATTGKITVSNGKLNATTQFTVSLQNYKIKVEESYKDRIKDEIKLMINFDYSPMETQK